MSYEIVTQKEYEVNALDFFKGNGVETFLADMRDRVDKFEADVTTDLGKDKIRSAAASIARAKVAIDNKGKESLADLKSQIKEIDSRRKEFRDGMDALKVEVRQPLTDLEENEKRKIAEEIHRKAEEERIRQEEKDREEARIQAELEAREKAIREQEEKIRKEKEALERREREARIAAEARIKAQEEAKQALIDAENRRLADIERAKQEAERKRQEEIAFAQREKEREAAEEQVRIQDENHRKKIHKEIYDAIIQLGILPQDATVVGAGLAKGKIPHVRIEY